MSILPCWDSKKNKWVDAGIFSFQHKEFTKTVKKKHYMRLVGGYGIQEKIITRLGKMGCETVCIHAPKGHYTSSFKDWLAPDIKVLDYGHGKQRFLPVKRMRKLL